MSLIKVCSDCGALTAAARCANCKPRETKKSATRRGYDAAWQRLSTRARRLQPWCSDCGAVDDLTVDHSKDAWEARGSGREITLDMVTVVCRPCNSRRGQARDLGTRPVGNGEGPSGKAQFASLPSGSPRLMSGDLVSNPLIDLYPAQSVGEQQLGALDNLSLPVIQHALAVVVLLVGLHLGILA